MSDEHIPLVSGLFVSLRMDKVTPKQFCLPVLRPSAVLYNSTSTTYSCVVHPGMDGGFSEAPVPSHKNI